MRTQTCGNCKFWDNFFGYCRARPPVFVSEEAGTSWPSTGPQDWCGAWRASDKENARIKRAIEDAQESLGE